MKHLCAMLYFIFGILAVCTYESHLSYSVLGSVLVQVCLYFVMSQLCPCV